MAAWYEEAVFYHIYPIGMTAVMILQMELPSKDLPQRKILSMLM